jgi:hypothetical protein
MMEQPLDMRIIRYKDESDYLETLAEHERDGWELMERDEAEKIVCLKRPHRD